MQQERGVENELTIHSSLPENLDRGDSVLAGAVALSECTIICLLTCKAALPEDLRFGGFVQLRSAITFFPLATVLHHQHEWGERVQLE